LKQKNPWYLFYVWLWIKPCPLLFEIWSKLRVVFYEMGMNVLHFFCLLCIWSVLIERFSSLSDFVKFNLFEFWFFLLVCFQVDLVGLTQSGQLLMGHLGRVNSPRSTQPGKNKFFFWLCLNFVLGLRMCLAIPL